MPIKNVLVVDDSRSARLMLRKMLQGISLNADIAESAEEALEYLRSRRPDAIFMDHTMPGMDGLQATKLIKENPETAYIPIAMYTSKEGEHYVEQVKAHGAVGILSKPATPGDLSKIIQMLNEELDSATHKPQQQPAAKPPSAPPPPLRIKGSIEAIEDIARTTAEEAISEAIQTQIIPLLEQKLSHLREDMLASNTSTFTEVAGKIYESRANLLSNRLSQQIDTEFRKLKTHLEASNNPKLLEEIEKIAQASAAKQVDESALQITETTVIPLIEEKLSQFREDLQAAQERTMTDVAENLYQTHGGELWARLNNQINAKLAEFKAESNKPSQIDSQTLEKLQNAVKSIATRQATYSAQQVVQQSVQETIDKVSSQVMVLTNSVVKRVYAIVSLLIIIGVGAVAALYHLG